MNYAVGQYGVIFSQKNRPLYIFCATFASIIRPHYFGGKQPCSSGISSGLWPIREKFVSKIRYQYFKLTIIAQDSITLGIIKTYAKTISCYFSKFQEENTKSKMAEPWFQRSVEPKLQRLRIRSLLGRQFLAEFFGTFILVVSSIIDGCVIVYVRRTSGPCFTKS